MSGLDMSFMDDSDDDGPTVAPKYMAPTQESAPQQVTNASSPVTDVMEMKEPERVAPVLTVSTIAAKTVQAIAKNPTFLNLECGRMNSEQRQLCQQTIGFAPLDLMDADVQRDLFAKNPVLGEAFDSPVMKPFAMAVNNSSQEICCNMITASLALSGLDNVLELMGGNAKGRQEIISMTLRIQDSINGVGRQTDAFALNMVRIMRTVGEAAVALKYGAEIDRVVELLGDIQKIIMTNRENVATATEEAEAEMNEVMRFIKDNMRSADKSWTERENHVKALRKEWQDKHAAWKDAQDFVHKQEVALEGKIRAQKVQSGTYKRELAKLEQQRQYLLGRAKRVRDRKDAYESQRDGIHDDEVKQDSTIQGEAQQWIKDEIKQQEAGIESRIKDLVVQSQKLAAQSAKFENESISATDGRSIRTEVTTRRSGLFGIWRSTHREDRMVQARPNEKERLVELAKKIRQEKHQIDAEIANLRQEKANVRKAIKLEIQEQAQQNRNRHLSTIEAQVQYLTGLYRGIKTRFERVVQRIAEISTKKERVDLQLQQLKNEFNGIDRRDLNVKAVDEKSAREIFEREKENLQKHMEEMDLTNGTEYAALTTLLSRLNGSIGSLPHAMSKLQNSFQVAYEAMSGNLFASLLETIPPENQRAFLIDTTQQFQALCSVSWTVMQAPVRSLTLNRASTYDRFQASLEAPNNAVVEEA